MIAMRAGNTMLDICQCNRSRPFPLRSSALRCLDGILRNGGEGLKSVDWGAVQSHDRARTHNEKRAVKAEYLNIETVDSVGFAMQCFVFLWSGPC